MIKNVKKNVKNSRKIEIFQFLVNFQFSSSFFFFTFFLHFFYIFLSFCLQGSKIHQNLEKFGTLQAKCKKNVKKM